MKTEEIFADDNFDLEEKVKVKEQQGWVRQGEPEVVHSKPDENGATIISVCQVMTKDEEDDS